MSVLFQLLKRA